MPVFPLLLIAGALLGVRAARQRRRTTQQPVDHHGMRMYPGCSRIEFMDDERSFAFVEAFRASYPLSQDEVFSSTANISAYFEALLSEAFPQCRGRQPSIVDPETGQVFAWQEFVVRAYQQAHQN